MKNLKIYHYETSGEYLGAKVIIVSTSETIAKNRAEKAFMRMFPTRKTISMTLDRVVSFKVNCCSVKAQIVSEYNGDY